jgi:hypothetical protein
MTLKVRQGVGKTDAMSILKSHKLGRRAASRPEGWNAWVTFSISPAAAPPPLPSTLIHK